MALCSQDRALSDAAARDLNYLRVYRQEIIVGEGRDISSAVQLLLRWSCPNNSSLMLL